MRDSNMKAARTEASRTRMALEEDAQKMRETMRDLEDKCAKSEFENRQKEVAITFFALVKTIPGSHRSFGERQCRLRKPSKRAKIKSRSDLTRKSRTQDST